MKRSLRILVVSLVYPPDSIGGYEIMCAQVCHWLASRGHTIEVLTSLPVAAPMGEGFWQDGSIPVRRALSSYWDGRDCLSPPFRETLAIEQANQAHLQEVLAEYQPDVVSFWHMGALSLALITTTLRLGYPLVFVIGDDWLCYGGWADAWLRHFSSYPHRARGRATDRPADEIARPGESRDLLLCQSSHKAPRRRSVGGVSPLLMSSLLACRSPSSHHFPLHQSTPGNGTCSVLVA